MRFLKRDHIRKTVLIISDLHLGAGSHFEGKPNFLEDFYHDKELVEFFDYYSTESYETLDVELVINGDFFDFLAVPFVSYFDDEFWTQAAALDKLKIILNAHSEVIKGMDDFLKKKNKKIVYIIGNHDAELVFKGVREHFISILSKEARKNFSFYLEGEYHPVEGVLIKHGHEYERAHQFNPIKSIIKCSANVEYFVPPWGSHYVIRVINKFKEERGYINQLYPIRNFLIYGLIFDTLFVLRFLFAHIYYYIMVRVVTIFQKRGSLRQMLKDIIQDLQLFDGHREVVDSFFRKNKLKALIMGHTHQPCFETYEEGRIFINTGSWMKMVNLDFSSGIPGTNLTYCQIDISEKKPSSSEEFEHIELSLNNWQGRRELPYTTF